MIEHYHPKIAQLGVIVAIQAVEELPFYDRSVHDVVSAGEQRAYCEGLAAYREHIRTGTASESNYATGAGDGVARAAGSTPTGASVYETRG